MMLQVEQGGQQLTSERRVPPPPRREMLPAGSGTLPHRPWRPMSLVNGRGPQAKRCGRDEAKRKSVRKRLPLRGSRCVGDSPRKPLRHHREAATARDSAKHHREATPQRKARHHREATASREGARHIEKQLHSAKQGTFGRSNLPNQHHRDAHPAAMQHREAATAREGARHIGKQLHSAKQSTIGKQLPAGKPHGSIGKQLHSAKQGAIATRILRTSTIGTSNLPNQQHRDAHPAEPAASRRATC